MKQRVTQQKAVELCEQNLMSPDGLMLQGAQFNVLVLVGLKVDGQVAIMVPASCISGLRAKHLGSSKQQQD